VTLTLQPPISVDFGPKRPITNLTDGFVYVVMPHIVGVEKPEYVGGDGRGRNVDVNDRRSVNFAVVSGAVNGETPLYKGVRSIEVGPDVMHRHFTAGVSSDMEGNEGRPALGYARSPVVSAMGVGERLGVVELAAC
jgi:hypothetical protein